MLICWQTGKFRINLTALDLLAQNARYKVRITICIATGHHANSRAMAQVWIKANGVMVSLFQLHI